MVNNVISQKMNIRDKLELLCCFVVIVFIFYITKTRTITCAIII